MSLDVALTPCVCAFCVYPHPQLLVLPVLNVSALAALKLDGVGLSTAVVLVPFWTIDL